MFKSFSFLFYFFILSSCSIANSIANNFDSLSKTRITFGGNVGFILGSGISIDGYSGVITPLRKKKLEINYGYMFRKDGIDYPFEGWQYLNSNGFFLETNYYLSKRFYVGLRLALNKYTLVLKNDQQFYLNMTKITSDFSFIGLSGYFNFGYLLPVTNNLGVKFQGQISYNKRNYTWQEKYIDISHNVESNSVNINLGVGFLFKF
jgi:hypothetical protein